MSLSQPSSRTTLANRAFRCSAPAVSNSLPKTVVDSDSVAVFKSKLKTFLFSHFCFLFSLLLAHYLAQRLWIYDHMALYKCVYYYYYYDQRWSAMIRDDQRWSAMIKIDQRWSAMLISANHLWSMLVIADQNNSRNNLIMHWDSVGTALMSDDVRGASRNFLSGKQRTILNNLEQPFIENDEINAHQNLDIQEQWTISLGRRPNFTISGHKMSIDVAM